MPEGSGDWLDGIEVHWETFLDTPPIESDFSTAGVVVIPVPYDSTTTYRSGAREGPRVIIRASRHLEDYDLELDRDVSLAGIHTAPEIAPNSDGPRAMVEDVRRVVSSVVAAGKLPVMLGGEHTVTIGAVQALVETHPGLSVLYLDAHADLRDRYMGTSWGHASAARRLYDLCPLVMVGVRSMSAEEAGFARDVGLPMFPWGPEASRRDGLADEVVRALSSDVYVSVDLDVMDPSVMSAVGTPEPGGMAWDDLIRLLRRVAEDRRIVGFDVTELAPREGPEACAFTAAKLVYKLIGYSTGS